MKPQKAAIVILTYNNLQFSRDCIDSIRKHTEKGSYELIVVDNCSIDGTRDWLKEQDDIKLLLNEENVGFPKGCNMGIALAEPDSDILLLNNDTVVTPRWLKNLQTCLYSSEDIGAVGAVCNQNENLQGLDIHYDSLDEMQELADKNNHSDSRRWEQKAFLIGFCILIKREVLNRIGLLDEEYSPGYVEDNDLSLRIITAGYRLMLCHDCYIYHYLGSEFRKDLSKLYPILYKNRAIFEKRWGFSAFVFDEVKQSALRLFQCAENGPQCVLDMNCGIGVALLKLKYEHPEIKLYGIEQDEAKARIAKYFGEIVIAPAEEFPLCFPDSFFDCILIGRNLEHTNDPEQFLKNLRPYLKEGGVVIGEVQNVGHFSVIRNLLKGSWLYASGDTLQHSNHSYFAEDDLTTLCEKCGYHSPFVFHWYSILSDDDLHFMERLGECCRENRTYMYRTYQYMFRYQK